MNRCRNILERGCPTASQVGGGAFRGYTFQRGHGFKGDEFQIGHGGGGFGGTERYVTCRGRLARRRQRGAGWDWFNKILPFLTKGVRAVGQQAISTVADQAMNSSMQFLDDVLEGENVLDSAKHRLKEGGKALRRTAKAKAKDGAMTLARTAKRKLAERRTTTVSQQGSGVAAKRRKEIIPIRAAERAGRSKKPKLTYKHIFNKW